MRTAHVPKRVRKHRTSPGSTGMFGVWKRAWKSHRGKPADYTQPKAREIARMERRK